MLENKCLHKRKFCFTIKLEHKDLIHKNLSVNSGRNYVLSLFRQIVTWTRKKFFCPERITNTPCSLEPKINIDLD
ncbi:unnamed protein product [Rhizophagus irregularis]|nr:unnamed protein product [Rhizophagus irregularis]CAB5365973.1 unnamed protein product [Rhizophagus irregularis]